MVYQVAAGVSDIRCIDVGRFSDFRLPTDIKVEAVLDHVDDRRFVNRDSDCAAVL